MEGQAPISCWTAGRSAGVEHRHMYCAGRAGRFRWGLIERKRGQYFVSADVAFSLALDD